MRLFAAIARILLAVILASFVTATAALVVLGLLA